MVGALGRNARPQEDEDERNLATMSRDDLLAELARLRRDRGT